MGTHSATARHGVHAAASRDDAFFAEHGRTRAPRLVQWLATLRCPLSCGHCLAAGNGSAREEMSLADAARLVEQVAELGVDEFLLTGGEPLARADLPQVIAVLRANGVRWSLNTAAMPDRVTRRAIEAHPPSFVAVSLDGPRAVHDTFRGRVGAFDEVLESIAYFAPLAVDGTAAGTTVTSQNIARLGETFGLVVESGATAWGLHLVVPEGRALRRPDLFLSRSQLKGLLRFAAARRQHFPVTMADEIGYCGFWEPLVRDEPFFCGAGKAQCVVLPDGEVVPCTTLDRSASAGNVLRTPLREIWETGFAELREWTPRDECGRCRYAVACQGGCWLQRRHGTQCFKRAWHVPRALTKAGIAVCLGLAAAGIQPQAAEARGMRPPLEQFDASKMETLQRSIVQWYASQVGGRGTLRVEEIRKSLAEALPEDPGAKYFVGFIAGGRPKGIVERATQIEAALKTEQRSLCLIGLGWRDVTEWCFDSAGAGNRNEADKAALRRVLAQLGATGEAWRREIFAKKLDPFLRRSTAYRHFFASKAGPPPSMRLERGLAGKRGWTRPDITAEFVAAHPHAESMTLAATPSRPLQCVRGGKQVAFDGKLGVFDILLVPAKTGATLTLDTSAGKLDVALPPGSEATYADVLRLCLASNRKAVEKLVRWAGGYPRNAKGVSLALPLLHGQYRALEAKPDEASPSARRMLWWRLADLYLF